MLLKDVLVAARAQDEEHAADFRSEELSLEGDLASLYQEMRAVTSRIRPCDDNGSLITRLADLQTRIATAEVRLEPLRRQIAAMQGRRLDPDEAALALSLFDPVWEALTPHQRVRVVHLLVEQVDYDGAKGKLAIAFRSIGIKTLSQELAHQTKGDAP